MLHIGYMGSNSSFPGTDYYCTVSMRCYFAGHMPQAAAENLTVCF